MSVFDVCGLLIVIKVELLYGGLYYNIRVYTHHRIHHRLVNTGKIVYTLKRLVRSWWLNKSMHLCESRASGFCSVFHRVKSVSSAKLRQASVTDTDKSALT